MPRLISMRFKVIILYIFFFFCISNRLPAQESENEQAHGRSVINVTSEIEELNIGSRVYYLVDPTKSLTVDDVSEELDSAFQESKQETPNFGFSTEAHWFRIRIRNLTRSNLLLLEIRNPYLAHLRLYIPDGNGLYIEKSTGEQELVESREISYRHFIFKVPIEQNQEITIYLRAVTNAMMEVPLFIWLPDHFHDVTRTESYILGIYYGFLIVMIIYNLFLFVSTYDRTYIYYIGYVLFFLLIQMSLNGFAQINVWPNYLGWEKLSMPILLSFALLFFILFSINFLNSPLNTPKIFNLMRLSIVCSFLMIPAAILIDVKVSLPILGILNGFGLSSALISAFICVANKIRAARFYLLSFSAFITGAAIFILWVFGILPRNFFTVWSMQIGSALEVVLLSFGLADKINTMKREQVDLQEKTIKDHERLVEAFGRFVPLEFLSFLDRMDIAQVELGDHVEKEMTILFSDIRSFTEMSEGMSPEATFKFLNSYFKRMNPIIRSNKGFIDKLIGDAIMALFPFSADNALEAAIEMQRELRLYNQHRLRSSYDSVNIGIGLHTGRLILGTIGSPERMDSTVISDSVNLASRIESLTKKYGCTILISEKTLQNLSDPSRYNFRVIDRVRVKGKKETVAVFHVFDGISGYMFDFFNKTKGDFERGINCYINRDYAGGLQYFQKVLDVNPMDTAAELYFQRGLMRSM